MASARNGRFELLSSVVNGDHPGNIDAWSISASLSGMQKRLEEFPEGKFLLPAVVDTWCFLYFGT